MEPKNSTGPSKNKDESFLKVIFTPFSTLNFLFRSKYRSSFIIISFLRIKIPFCSIISSESVINNLELENIQSDAIDIDFGTLVFKNISCKKIKNDCLDISGANVVGDKLVGLDVNDKGLSFGEKSIGKITNIDFDNTKLGIAVKDGSKLDLSNLELRNNQFHVAVFNKKKEYEGASLTLNNFENNEKLNYLLGVDNEIFFEKNFLQNKIKNKEINKLFY